MASFYGVYHGPKGLTAIAKRIFALADALKTGLEQLNFMVIGNGHFDTLTIEVDDAKKIQKIKSTKKQTNGKFHCAA